VLAPLAQIEAPTDWDRTSALFYSEGISGGPDHVSQREVSGATRKKAVLSAIKVGADMRK